jgi:hypothetical protein
VETSLVQPIEEAVNTIEGITELRAGSGQGTSNVIITFNLNRDIEAAARTCAIASLRCSRPSADALPAVVSKFDSDPVSIVSIALVSNRPIRELTEIATRSSRNRSSAARSRRSPDQWRTRTGRQCMDRSGSPHRLQGSHHRVSRRHRAGRTPTFLLEMSHPA